MYLFQFDLDIRHKSEKDHVILNALSRLFSLDEKLSENQNNNILNDIKTYVDILIKMFSVFKNRLIQIYKTNNQWASLFHMLATILSIQATRKDIIETKSASNKKQKTLKTENTIMIRDFSLISSENIKNELSTHEEI